MRTNELKNRQRDILGKRSKEMIIAVCSTNPTVRDMLSQREGIDPFFMDDLEGINIPEYDLVLVDIAMCKGNMDTARMQSKKTVFFTTEINSGVLDKLIYNFGTEEHLYHYTFRGNTYSINLDEIAYFESDHKQIRAYFETGEFVRFYAKLDDVQNSVDEFGVFLRVNKSYLINYNYCELKNGYVKVLGESVQISRLYKKELKDRLDFIKKM